MNYLNSNDTKNLFKALLCLQDEEECKIFLRDLLTKKEIQEVVNRFKVAQMLSKKIPYTKIEKETGISSTTIAKISKRLTKGMGGYKLVMDRLNGPSENSMKNINIKRATHPTPPSGGVIFGA